VGELDLRHLGPFGSSVTDAAVSSDGRRVVVRTYVAVLELEVPQGASLASIWGQQPRGYPMEGGGQSEGITYRADGGALLMIGEGIPAILYQSEWRC
jgi:hypothetical protein